ncbi:MAG: immunity 17 family protein [Phocaeicola sp.]
MKMHYVMQAIFATMGILSILASLLNWKWFFAAQNMQAIISHIGYTGARIFYAVVGILLVAIALYFFFEVQKVT